MATGNELLRQKQEAMSARQAVRDRENRGSLWFLAAWLMGLMGIVFGSVFILPSFIASSMDKVPASGFGSTFLGGLGIGVIALGALLMSLRRIAEKSDNELKRLKEAEPVATDAYFNALMIEASSYGIDTKVRSNRTDFMDTDYEFTTMRNGETIDVSVREFNDEIVFMLNGERMKKLVTV